MIEGTEFNRMYGPMVKRVFLGFIFILINAKNNTKKYIYRKVDKVKHHVLFPSVIISLSGYTCISYGFAFTCGQYYTVIHYYTILL